MVNQFTLHQNPHEDRDRRRGGCQAAALPLVRRHGEHRGADDAEGGQRGSGFGGNDDWGMFTMRNDEFTMDLMGFKHETFGD